MTCIGRVKERLDVGESVDLRGAFCAHCHLLFASMFAKTAISHMTLHEAREAYPCLQVRVSNEG